MQSVREFVLPKYSCICVGRASIYEIRIKNRKKCVQVYATGEKKTLFKKRVTLNGVSFVTSTEKRQCMIANKI